MESPFELPLFLPDHLLHISTFLSYPCIVRFSNTHPFIYKIIRESDYFKKRTREYLESQCLIMEIKCEPYMGYFIQEYYLNFQVTMSERKEMVIKLPESLTILPKHLKVVFRCGSCTLNVDSNQNNLEITYSENGDEDEREELEISVEYLIQKDDEYDEELFSSILGKYIWMPRLPFGDHHEKWEFTHFDIYHYK